MHKALISLGICICVLSACALVSAPLPKGRGGEQAELYTDHMLKSLNAQAFNEAEAASWQIFSHHFLWHKALNRVRVKLNDELIVYLDLNLQKGWALEKGQRPTAEQEKDYVERAISTFNNDSFWAFAPFKVKDPGTVRQLVQTDEGQALLVFYQSGGSTPGDHYLWYLDQAGRPKRWQMWVSVIPIGGLSSQWEDWVQTDSGAWVSTKHSLSLFDFELSQLQVTRFFEQQREPDPKLIVDWKAYLK